jgi:hypothetical protein
MLHRGASRESDEGHSVVALIRPRPAGSVPAGRPQTLSLAKSDVVSGSSETPAPACCSGGPQCAVNSPTSQNFLIDLEGRILTSIQGTIYPHLDDRAT